jgi:Flp pilus assembly protein TadG
MIRFRSNLAARMAAIAPLTAVLLVPLLGMVAFAVDIGWISLTQSDLQNAADSAALAAAGQMTSGFVNYNLPGQSAANQGSILSTAQAAARTYAKKFAGYNEAGGVSLAALPNTDVEFGSTDASGNYTTPAAGYPNTVRVTVRRDATANGPLGLFFGPVLGLSTVNLKATAASAIYAVNIDSFTNNANLNVNMLPMTYDVNHWNNFVATGTDPDGVVNKDANGSPQLNIYPSVKDTGNFGLLSLDGSHAGASTISGWIDSGLQPNDVQGLLAAGGQTPLLPLSQHNSTILPSASTDGMGSWNWIGEPGMKTSVLHTLANYTGSTYILPLFSPLNANSGASYAAGNGQGANYYYNIVKFVSVQVIYVDNKSVIVVPGAAVVNLDNVVLSAAATPAVAASGGSGATLPTTFAPPKLSQ